MSLVLESTESAPASGGVLPRLSGLFRRYAGRILGVYALFNVENLLRLAQPIALGWAIDGLLSGSWVGVAVLAAQHLASLILTVGRQAIDTRVFAGIYADMVSGVVVEQRGRDVPVSMVAARSDMSREFVDFFEQHLPALFRAGWSLAGALLMLLWFDWVLVLFCLGLLIPAGLLNAWYGRRTLFLSRMMHGEQEREVDVIERGDKEGVGGHYDRVRGWWVRLSDAEAINTGIMELFVLALIVGALGRYCTVPGASTGDIFAVFRYVLMFVMALDGLPMLVRHVSQLRDVARRINMAPDEEAIGER
jgi:ABC-type multidrug transport system fused ATPase/permease subunit